MKLEMKKRRREPRKVDSDGDKVVGQVGRKAVVRPRNGRNPGRSR